MFMRSLCIILVTLSTTAFAAYEQLNGTWKLTERICSDGAKPDDSFTVGKDSLEMTYDGAKATITRTLNGKTESFQGNYSVDSHIVTMTYKPDESEKYLYFLNDDELSLVTSDFADGGTCHLGKSLLTVFKRE